MLSSSMGKIMSMYGMLPSLLLLGIPSISNLTAFTSPSPLKPRKEILPEVVPWLNSVSITPGARLNSSQL
ncbi:hypothetical protein D3C76_1670720 [compost metagenome]